MRPVLLLHRRSSGVLGDSGNGATTPPVCIALAPTYPTPQSHAPCPWRNRKSVDAMRTGAIATEGQTFPEI